MGLVGGLKWDGVGVKYPVKYDMKGACAYGRWVTSSQWVFILADIVLLILLNPNRGYCSSLHGNHVRQTPKTPSKIQSHDLN